MDAIIFDDLGELLEVVIDSCVIEGSGMFRIQLRQFLKLNLWVSFQEVPNPCMARKLSTELDTFQPDHCSADRASHHSKEYHPFHKDFLLFLAEDLLIIVCLLCRLGIFVVMIYIWSILMNFTKSGLSHNSLSFASIICFWLVWKCMGWAILGLYPSC